MEGLWTTWKRYDTFEKACADVPFGSKLFRVVRYIGEVFYDTSDSEKDIKK
jgi:hypothetical protein